MNDWYAQAWENKFGEFLFGTPTEKSTEQATITKLQTRQKITQLQREMRWLE